MKGGPNLHTVLRPEGGGGGGGGVATLIEA